MKLNSEILFDRKVLRILVLILIICLAIFLRFYNLTERGLIYYDEGYYANQAKFIVLSFGWIRNNIQEIFSQGVNLERLWDFVNENGGTFPHTRKPGHDLLNAISFSVFGIHDWSLFFISAFFGTGTVVLVYFLGRDFCGDGQSGLVASAILAVSGFHIWFSRSAMAQSSAVFFVILGVYLYCKSFSPYKRRTGSLFLGGVCTGFALTIHPNLFIIPILLSISEIFFLIKERMHYKGLKGISDSLYFGFFILVPLAVLQLPYLILKMFYAERLSSLSSHGPFSTYWGQVAFISKHITGRLSVGNYSSGKVLAVFFGYLKSLWVSEGALVIIFSVFGVLYLYRRFHAKKDPQSLLLLLLLFFPLFFWGLSGVTFRLRLIYIVLPALSVVSGIGAKSMLDVFRGNSGKNRMVSFFLVSSFIIYILVAGSFKAWAMINLKAKPVYRQLQYSLVNYMEKAGGILTDKQGHFYPIMRFYLGNLSKKFPKEFRGEILLNSRVTRERNIPDYGDYIVMLGDEWKDPPAGDFMKKMISGCIPIISLEYPAASAYSDSFHIKAGEFQLLKVFDLRKRKP